MAYRPINSMTQFPGLGDMGASERMHAKSLAQDQAQFNAGQGARDAQAEAARLNARRDLMREGMAAQKQQIEMGKGFRERENLTARAMEQYAAKLQQAATNPQLYQAAYRQAQQEIATGVERGQYDPTIAMLPADPVDPQALGPVIESLRERQAVTMDPSKWNEEQTGAANLLAEMKQDSRLQDVTVAMRDPDFAKAKQQYLAQEMARRKAGATTVHNVMPGSQDLERSTRTKIQGELIENKESLLKLTDILKDAKPEQFTYGAELKQKAAGILGRINPDWVPSDWATQAAARDKVMMSVEQMFNTYRVETTGASAPMAELETLKKAYINKDLPWHEFVARAQGAMDQAKRAIRVRNRLLAGGLDVASEGFGERMDSLMSSGIDANSDDDARLRATQLKQMGLSQEEARRVLENEGYL